MDNPYKVGERVLASRAQDGENHEEATVVDAYSLIMGGDEQPMVCVAFDDGERVYLRPDGSDVLPLPEDEEPEEEAAAADE